jgi:hypothetical protein
VNPSDVPAWLQAGGLLAFAAAVWMEQRSMRATLDAMRGMMAAVLEHVRDDKPRGEP